MGDLAERVVVHDKVGVDESASSDTIVIYEGRSITTDTAECAVNSAPTLPIAGGGTKSADDPKESPRVGVDKTLANLVVACNL